ncbi:hypothetical protein G9H61_06595 [Aquirufa ecclesiirivi]|uniref:CDP-glycerol--glycerophosphate glycerophosphotransferase n=1 Tax=Aquirufa ecclesiirivi TaxID=2715124 RepID=A0ABT4JHR5_9BACT|nr:hypothetical protein [Aquirufa ecclesiirivi]MCZ2475106.1 hypothetical protein [Aquirufa ecclesiirivi]
MSINNHPSESLFTQYSRNLAHKYADLLKYELDQRCYYYGDHYLNSLEKKHSFKAELEKNALEKLIDAFVLFKSFSKTSQSAKILSTAYHNIPEKFKNEQFSFSRPPWNYNKQPSNVFDFALYQKAKHLTKQIGSRSFEELFSEEFSHLMDGFSKQLEGYLVKNHFVANFLPADVGFFEKLSIQVGKQLGIPSFLFIHGLPAAYNSIENNRTDYLVVWGEAIKRNFVENGIASSKIIVAGHPAYSRPLHAKLRNEWNDILVVTKSIPGSQLSHHYAIKDRSNLIYYLGVLQQTLESIGVKSVRLRPHPSENIEWYKKWIDNRFYRMDVGPLSTALDRSSLVIGPTSTLFVESLVKGVNYVVYEPYFFNGTGLDGNILVPPFDGSDHRVPVANSAEGLVDILSSKKCADLSILEDYISEEFDTSQIIDKIPSS